jgi:hypothetical protein
MSISTYLEPISRGSELVEKLLSEEFKIGSQDASRLYNSIVKEHFEKLRSDLYLLAETEYVDKVYRDSYYNYYSSKLSSYLRNCIRISLFEGPVTEDDFWNRDKRDELASKYLGFLILRPTSPQIIGRSIISPRALKLNNFISCTSKFNTTANGQKFEVIGFPHSSQDSETMSCAETSLWAIMEYFSSKYPEYRPVLPSKIIETLNHLSSERQLPSKGLGITHMSYALREFGFGSRVYSKQEFGSDFESLLSCYVESGIPLIIAMENRPHGNIGHALLAIGHEELTESHIDNIKKFNVTDSDLSKRISRESIELYDYDSIAKEFIFIDDNRPIYQRAYLDKPAQHYPDSDWHNCQITYFIVPLYAKIYLEAYYAKSYVLRLLLSGLAPLNSGSKVVIRTYLASGRSFKDQVSKNSFVGNDLKAFLLETSMPKFIWVSELSTKELMKKRMADGIVILDATEANLSFNKPLILAAYQGKYLSVDETSGKIEAISLNLPSFRVYEHNLNAFNK